MEPAEIERLVGEAVGAPWTKKVELFRKLAVFVGGAELSAELQQRLRALVLEASADPKWEVRKASLLVLKEIAWIEKDVLMDTFSRLSRDSNRWVVQAANRTLRQMRARKERDTDWPVSEESQDPTLQLIFSRIREIGLRSLSPSAIYDLATEVGEQFYRVLAADTAHELRNLITPIEGYLLGADEYMSIGPMGLPKARRSVERALLRLQRVEAMIRDLRYYSSPNTADFRPEPLEAMIHDAVSIARTDDGRETRPALKTDVSPELRCDVERERFVRALSNLVSNAEQATADDGEIVISAAAVGAEFIDIRVSDTGRGMSSEQIEQAMERFSTTRREDGGTGLGLPIVQRIVEQDHSGDLTISSAPGEGTSVTIRIPRTQPRAKEPKNAIAKNTPRRR